MAWRKRQRATTLAGGSGIVGSVEKSFILMYKLFYYACR